MRTRTIILVLAVFLAGCAREQMGDCFKGRGREVEEVRYLAPFTALVLNDKIDVVIAQDTTATAPRVVVKAGQHVVPNITTEVHDGALHISDRMRCNWVRSFRVRPVVHITVAALDRILNQGVGDVTAITPIRTAHLHLEQWDGNGKVTLHLQVGYCQVELHTGVGEVILSGSADQAYYYGSTLGRVDARSLVATNVRVNNSGACDMFCHATSELHVDIRSLGDVYYAGLPTHVSTTITGQGQLLPL